MLFLQMNIFGSPVNLNREKAKKITCLRVVDVQKNKPYEKVETKYVNGWWDKWLT